MSHKLISTKSVMYNAQTQQTSVLTILAKSVNFVANRNGGASGTFNHSVEINSVLFATFETDPQFLGSLNHYLSEVEWDAFYNSQTYTTTDPYDKVVECALYYTRDTLTTMYGLTKNDWILADTE